jgi:hypothetical protein
VANLSRLARQVDLIEDQDPEVGGTLVEDGEASLASFVGRFQRIFHGLAQEIREARRAIQENHRLREDNRQLRHALNDCVEACGRYLAPLLEDSSTDPEEDDHTRARDAIARARRLLEDGPPRLAGR